MRAEEGDETVNDYATEGKQTLGRIKDTQRAGSPLGRVVRRLSKFLRGEQDSSSGANPTG
jgi:hypothetical protein